MSALRAVRAFLFAFGVLFSLIGSEGQAVTINQTDIASFEQVDIAIHTFEQTDIAIHEFGGWRVIGGDACKKNVNCTANWAYTTAVQEGVLPLEVANQAITAFAHADLEASRGKSPDWETFLVCKGDVLSTTFGATHLRFVAHETALFEGCTTAHGWTFFDAASGTLFEVFRVAACSNYSSRPVRPSTLISELIGPPIWSPSTPITVAYTSPASVSTLLTPLEEADV